jgi:arginase family enzyme
MSAQDQVAIVPRPLVLIGAASSAGAYAPGQEKAPAAFRRYGPVAEINPDHAPDEAETFAALIAMLTRGFAPGATPDWSVIRLCGSRSSLNGRAISSI